MTPSNRPHPFTEKKQIDERCRLLSCWLNPVSAESMVINGVPPTSKQLAEALSRHFNIRLLSLRSIHRYVKEAQQTFADQQLITRGRGRPAYSNDQEAVNSPTQTQDLPRKERVRKNKGLITAANQIKPRPSRPISAKAQCATLHAQLAAEAVHLTGLSPSALHKTFSGQTAWKIFLGVRSSFFHRLKTKLTDIHLAGDKSSRRPDDDLDHSLRLHQVILHTLDSQWCVFLFAYEPRSHFLNAACYVVHPNMTDRPTGSLGRSIKRFHSTWRATFTQENSQTTLHLPAEALLKFTIETRALMGVPVDSVWLSPSLGDQATLPSKLEKLAPKYRFSKLSGQYQPFICPEAGKSIRVTTLCRQLEKVLNSHNQKLAFKKLKESQIRVDQHIKKIFQIHNLPSGHTQYKRLNTVVTLGESVASKAKRKQENDLAEFHRKMQSRSNDVGKPLKIGSVYLTCDVC